MKKKSFIIAYIAITCILLVLARIFLIKENLNLHTSNLAVIFFTFISVGNAVYTIIANRLNKALDLVLLDTKDSKLVEEFQKSYESIFSEIRKDILLILYLSVWLLVVGFLRTSNMVIDCVTIVVTTLNLFAIHDVVRSTFGIVKIEEYILTTHRNWKK